MRLLAGLESPLRGSVDLGSSNVVVSYFAQDQSDTLDPRKSVLETVLASCPEHYLLTDVRGLLSQFMFKGDDAKKLVRELSGGEKARLTLCKLMMEPTNILLLDEVLLTCRNVSISLLIVRDRAAYEPSGCD
jgi:ATP-binding cassette subfamily F protein 3